MCPNLLYLLSVQTDDPEQQRLAFEEAAHYGRYSPERFVKELPPEKQGRRQGKPKKPRKTKGLRRP